MAWYIGLMSGTSLDGIDGVIAEFTAGESTAPVRAHLHAALPPALRAELLALNTAGADELHRAAVAANALADAYAGVAAQLLQRAGMTAGEITAIGAHGQTVRHRPRDFDGLGYSLQLLNGARLAEVSAIDVVCDFRSRDVAAGGEGAPLVPAFHAARFAARGRHRAVLNLGGIANLSLLGAQGEVLGFDCGPGNVLMDLWCQQQLGQAYDAAGAWAASGRLDPTLLASLMAEPYLARAAPKSTGRDLFDQAWLQLRLAGTKAEAADVMHTLCEFTTRSVVQGLQRQAPLTQEVFVCGGGAFNAHLMARLADLLGGFVRVSSTASLGVPPDQVEALAFAWLASAFVARVPGNLPSVTGARGPRILGALYPSG